MKPVLNEKVNLSGWALNNQQMVSFFMLLIIAMGAFCYEKLPRNEDPAFTIKTAVVSAQWPGASVTDTTRLLTDTLEKKLQETPWLDYLESETRAGRSVIYVNLRDDTPPEKVPDIWYQVRKKMQDIAPSLPEGVQGPAVDDEFDDTFGTIYGFIPEGYTLREVRDQVETIRRELMSLPDIGKTTLLGEQQEQIVLSFSPARLAGMGLNIQQVADALRAQNAVVPAGIIRTGQENMAIKVSGELTSEASLRAVTLHINDRYLPLTDIATVSRENGEPPQPVYRVNGKPAIGLAISMAPTGNMLRFGAALNAKMHAISVTLPHGIEMVKVADQSAVVSDAVSGFIRVLIEAVAIVLAVSFVSLGLRAGLVVAAAIPRRQAATRAFKTTAFPMLTGTLVMIAGFIPVGFAASSAGEYCFSLFAVVLIALLCSWVVAILFSPLTGTWLLSDNIRQKAKGPGWMARGYQWLLRKALRHRFATVCIALIVLGLSVYGTTFMQGEFFPASDRPELLVSLTLPPNASQSETQNRVEKLEKALAGNRNVERFSTYVGSGAIRFYLPMDVLLANENIAQMVVVAKDLKARDRLHRQLNRILATRFSDIITRVSPLELGPPVGWPVKYRVSGPDYLKVRSIANRLSDVIGRSPSSREVNQTAGEPERVMTLKVNQTAARAAGVSSESLARMLNTVWSGSIVTSVRENDRLVDVVLRARDNERLNLATFSSLTIQGNDGKQIPLSAFATPVWGVDDPVIWRRQRLPFITVQTDLAPGLRAEAVSAALRPAVDRLRAELPEGYSIEEGGAVAESEKGNSSVYAVLPVTMVIMLLLLMLQLRNYSRMALAILMAPFGLPGIVLAMLPGGTPMGFVALLGVIALAGMIIRNAVILISEVDSNLAQGMASDAAIIAAAEHRARPICLTACAAILGMIPISHQVFWGPMAYAIIGGLLIATLVTLTVLPASLSLLLHLRMTSSGETCEK
ncbi:efflux RND transporter permease subunit [Klebsiella quasipneumoniae]|uniref:efflux RND transporter permease subunit n=1 Tax=Klebsiella quasipneumoniae TaxID=1463165 RepID=UPI00223769D9|nr:efflux RND transporter permease subunit [Klebsiella quasipneumoniae]MCW4603809.1 efflux RND transporter permease subunit [Klebsiella quasipneumoniae]MCW4618471.1 efflux RND transporter permease subunit [Klebsiella quasipneumoniae]